MHDRPPRQSLSPSLWDPYAYGCAGACTAALDASAAQHEVLKHVLAACALGGALPWAGGAAYEWLRPRRCRVCCGAGYSPCSTCHGRGKDGGLITDQPLQVRSQAGTSARLLG